ncbi:MAG: polysaccharide biosynthesis/export family protein [Vulcanimicrobiaceae bacterium]
MARKLLFCAALALAFVALVDGHALAAASPQTILHPGDKIIVTVYNHPELTTQPAQPAVIDASGRLWMPVAGLVDATNLTPDQLSTKIEDHLRPYVKKPAVNVSLVAQAQSIFLTGAAGGVYPYTPGETLLGALTVVQQSISTSSPTVAGGLVDPSQVAAHELQNGSLELHHVVIRRDGRDLPPVDATALLASGEPGPALQPDDTIELGFRPIAVTVSGDVRQSGVAHLDSGQPISDALRQLGGEDEATATDRFELTRDGKKEIVTKSTASYREPAQDGDVVYVPPGIHVGVVGQVAAPTRVLLQGDQTLLSAIYFAGGPTKYGDIKHVRLLHDGTQKEYDVTALTHGGDGQEANNPRLADGDTVFVPEGHKIDFSSVFQAIIAGSYLRFL